MQNINLLAITLNFDSNSTAFYLTLKISTVPSVF